MGYDTGIGKLGMAVAVLIAIAMSVLSFLYHPVEIIPVQYGICLPSPDSWDFDALWSGIVNLLLIGLITILLYIINRSYNFVRTNEPVLYAVFLIMATSGPWFTEYVNTSVIICLANVICIGIIFDSYDSKNATQQMFILGVVAGTGSMVQYGFLPMAVVYFLWALFMKVLRVKETLALIAGIICPYWIALGFGWIRISDLHFPSITPLFGQTRDHTDFLLMLIGIAVAACLGFIVTIINSMKLYAGNSKVNAMNLCVSALGVASVVCILVDFDNIHAYVLSLYMACAVQIANICALWNPGMPWIVTAFPSVIYIAIFVCSFLF